MPKPDLLPKQSSFVNRLSAHLAWLGGLLSDGRDFLLGAEPSAADLCAYHPLWHVRRAGGDPAAAAAVTALVPALRALLPWMDRVAALGHGEPHDMPASEALAIAAGATPVEPGESGAGLSGVERHAPPPHDAIG